MYNILKIAFTFLLLTGIAFATDYKLYTPENYSYTKKNSMDEKILFILDFSNSMTETLDGKLKIDLMLDTISNILPEINSDTQIGLRVYGHKMGFSAFDACRASTLKVPIGPANSKNIENALSETHPRGMTPITFSLKQAVKYDFLGITGQKRIILLTDGGENCDESPCKYVMELIKIRKDICIDVIAFNIRNKEDLEQLECTALVTSGKFYTADTAAELSDKLSKSVKGTKEVEAKIIRN